MAGDLYKAAMWVFRNFMGFVDTQAVSPRTLLWAKAHALVRLDRQATGCEAIHEELKRIAAQERSEQ